MRSRQMRDSQGIFEVSVIMLLLIIILTALFGLAADAIDKTATNEAVALDQQISPAQRAEVIGRLQ